jgi:broad specificity phosphatase PhoE
VDAEISITFNYDYCGIYHLSSTPVVSMSSSTLLLLVIGLVVQPAMCFTAYVIRHGQTDANANEIEQGSADFSRLTELGKEQASNAYQALVGTSVTSIYTSPLTRARQTLDQLRQADAQTILPPSDLILNDLREIDQYDWQGQSYSELQRKFPESWRAWQKGIPNEMKVLETATKIERYPIIEMWERADRVWNEILDLEKQQHEDDKMDRTVLIVAHGNLGQALLGTAMGWDASRFQDEDSVFGNCGMAEIEFLDLDTSPRKVASRWRWRWPVPSAWSSTT